MGIGLALRAASEASAAAEKASIAAALQPLAFSPRSELANALKLSLEKRQVPFAPMEDNPASETARTDWDFSGVPADLDALLDVDLQYCGYYFEKKAGGFVPSAYFAATLLGTRAGGSRIERYYVQADVWPSGGERRYVATSPRLTLKSLSDFEQQRDLVTQEMRSLLTSMAEILAEDVDRTVRKLPQLQ